MENASIWDNAKIIILDSIPEDIESNFEKSLSFYEWREKGAYHVTGATQADFYLSCAHREYGSMLVKEVDYLIEQALEHRATIDYELNGKLKSPTWTMVTIYYWCLFSSIAWLRLHGKIVTYLPSEETERFKKLYSHKTKFPSNGTFLFQRRNTDESITGSKVDILCKRLKTNNFHDGLWNQFHIDIK